MARQDEDSAFRERVNQLTGVLEGVAEKLDDLAESLEVGGD
jgi:hypothetical protein